MEKEKFYNIVKIKTELITMNLDKLETKYTDLKNYLDFLKNISLLLKFEDAFLLLSSSFIYKVRSIIELNRFNVKDMDKDINTLINDIVIKINELEGLRSNYKRYLVYNYIDYQNEVRHVYYGDLANFLGAMSLDYEILSSLMKNDIRNYSNDEVFLATTNYFMEICPQIYEDSEIFSVTREKLVEIEKKKFSFKDRNIKQLAKATSYNFRNRWD